MNDKPAKIEIVTLKQLCAELKINPREAREAPSRRARHQKEPRTRQVSQTRARVGVVEEFVGT